MAKQKKAEAEQPAYVMPDVRVGTAVMWHPSQEAPADCMALVTAKSVDSVSLAILPPQSASFMVRDGVRHVNHPDRAVIAQSDEGVWSEVGLAGLAGAIVGDSEDMGALEARLAAIEERLDMIDPIISELTGRQT